MEQLQQCVSHALFDAIVPLLGNLGNSFRKQVLILSRFQGIPTDLEGNMYEQTKDAITELSQAVINAGYGEQGLLDLIYEYERRKQPGDMAWHTYYVKGYIPSSMWRGTDLLDIVGAVVDTDDVDLVRSVVWSVQLSSGLCPNPSSRTLYRLMIQACGTLRKVRY